MGGDAKRLRVSIVVPTFDEEPNIGQAVQELTAAADALFAEHEILVVDDGSTDGTRAVVEGLAQTDPRIRVLAHPRNLGYGEAVRSGFLGARLDYVFMTDADLQFDARELELLLPYVGRVDVVAGYRLNRCDPAMRRAIGYAWNILIRALFYAPVRDIDCAFKMFDRRVLETVDLQSVGAMINTEVMVKLARQGASVVEVGVHHRPRRAGEARGANPQVIATAFRELLRIRRRLASLDGSG
jgi:glycosyltransferase involved in cell wall biosynthesis